MFSHNNDKTKRIYSYFSLSRFQDICWNLVMKVTTNFFFIFFYLIFADLSSLWKLINCAEVFHINVLKNPAYGRHQISRPMQIEAPIFLLLKKKQKKINLEWLLVFKDLWVGQQMHQSNSLTPPICGPSMGAIWNNS